MPDGWKIKEQARGIKRVRGDRTRGADRRCRYRRREERRSTETEKEKKEEMREREKWLRFFEGSWCARHSIVIYSSTLNLDIFDDTVDGGSSINLKRTRERERRKREPSCPGHRPGRSFSPAGWRTNQLRSPCEPTFRHAKRKSRTKPTASMTGNQNASFHHQPRETLENRVEEASQAPGPRVSS